jgi:DNA-binding transcriptional regulator/RsmH inhibitor MraZ
MQPDGKQGRITLEQHLLDYAGYSRDVVAVGVGHYWRIMAPIEVAHLTI